MAEYFVVQLSQVRPRVELLHMDERLADQLIDMAAGDVLVLFEPRRATKHAIQLVEAARAAGVIVAVFTDERPPPVLAESEFVFPTTIDSITMFDSYAGLFALGSAVLAALIRRGPTDARQRADRLESLNTDLDTWYDRR